MSEKLPYNTHRKHRYYTQDHPLTAKQQRRVRRLRRIRASNARDASFGKINWAAYEHQQLWDMVQSSDPAAMGTAAHRWAQLAVGVDSATGDVHKTVQKLLMSWRGPSAVQAAQSASKLTAWGAGASGTMRDVGEGLDSYTSALLEARNNLPKPVYYSDVVHFREGYDVKASSGPSGAILADQLLDDHLPTKREASTAKAEAVRVMERYEAASKHVHDRLPHFADAPEATAGVGDSDQDSGGPRGHDSTVASSVPVGGPGAGAPGGVSASGFGGNPVLSDGRGALAAGSVTGSGAPAGSAGGAAAASAQGSGGAGAGARGAGPGGGMGMYPPGGGAHGGEGAAEHRNRYGDEFGVDFLDDLPPAYPPVFGE
ncbi:WXG100 family type VII secretion target [Amycolatopsis taiwanensis]|uniref:PPE domain-containing protein n=1 Tax=Amycolatopsis taiwanensis TaxID=342230 RepID=A0A9W6R123_9PSEU|nr:PPE domain-containing protein [Amycolatopsis taiwanensis]GLY66465.1 hypothetical protein Atai01_30840 [Amycolatopsis taiwanensis]